MMNLARFNRVLINNTSKCRGVNSSTRILSINNTFTFTSISNVGINNQQYNNNNNIQRNYCNSNISSQTIHSGIQQQQQQQSKHTGPISVYDDMIANKKIRVDNYQRETVKLLQNLYDQLLKHKLPITETDQQINSQIDADVSSSSPSFSKWISKFTLTNEPSESIKNIPEIKGVYLFGDVGCGKSFLMDLFYDSINVKKKKRIHFHHFMLDVHKRIHKWRMNKSPDENDPIPPLAKELVKDAWLLCFDEFQVTDVSDAMILKRLFSHMFDHGAVLVTTSNRQPSDLYKNGLNRQLFLPFIDFLQQRCIVHNLNSGLDYRLSGTRTKRVFFTPNNESSKLEMDQLYQKLTHNEPEEQLVFAINASRSVTVPRASRAIARFTFKELCDTAIGAADYIVLAQNFHTLFVDDVPCMNESTKNQARRFIILVDVLYEHKVKLICSAEAQPNLLFMSKGVGSDDESVDAASDIRQLTDDLKLTPEQLSRFTGEEERFMFSRAVSRLVEMQSDSYLSSLHTPNK